MRSENYKMNAVQLIINDVHKTVVVLLEHFSEANDVNRENKN
jgi:hypothetical protein